MTVRLLQFFQHFEDLPHQRAAVQLLEDALAPELLASDAEWVQTYRAAPAAKPRDPMQAVAPLLALIRQGEGGYDSVNRGRAGDTPGGWSGLTAMTIEEVLAAQKAGKVFAVGAYQFIPATLQQAVMDAGLSGKLPFSPTVQDYLALVLLLGGRKRPKLTAYLKGDAVPIEDAQLELAKEWASLPGPDGRGFYDGDSAGNRASAQAVKVREALVNARKALNGRGIEAFPKPAAPAPPADQPKVPTYYSQRDNGEDRDRTCFTSSAAMLAELVKPGCIGPGNADYTAYYKLVQRYGDTTDAAAQIKALAVLGITARLVTAGDQQLLSKQVKRWGGLAVGWIHRGPVHQLAANCTGHWGLIYATDATHLMLHDPMGEPDLVHGGFISGRDGYAIRCSRANFGRRWEVKRVAGQWQYAPGNGWALVVDGVKR